MLPCITFDAKLLNTYVPSLYNGTLNCCWLVIVARAYGNVVCCHVHNQCMSSPAAVASTLITKFSGLIVKLNGRKSDWVTLPKVLLIVTLPSWMLPSGAVNTSAVIIPLTDFKLYPVIYYNSINFQPYVLLLNTNPILA